MRSIPTAFVAMLSVVSLIAGGQQADHFKALKDPAVDALSYAAKVFGEPTDTKRFTSSQPGMSRRRLIYEEANVVIVLKDAKPPATREGQEHWALVGFFS